MTGLYSISSGQMERASHKYHHLSSSCSSVKGLLEYKVSHRHYSIEETDILCFYYLLVILFEISMMEKVLPGKNLRIGLRG